MKYPKKLETKPWGNGSSPPGFTNIVAPEWDLVIASTVEEKIAEEIVKRWNNG